MLSLAIKPFESGLKRFGFADFDFRHQVSPPRGPIWRRSPDIGHKKRLIDLRENYNPALFVCQGFYRFCLLCGVPRLPYSPSLSPKGEYEDDKADDDNTEQADGAVE